MLHNNTWTESLGNFLLRAGNTVLDLFRTDMTQSKWGHRVMDQIFREGKFAPQSSQKVQHPTRHG
jgi:hypothetical protein